MTEWEASVQRGEKPGVSCPTLEFMTSMTLGNTLGFPCSCFLVCTVGPRRGLTADLKAHFFSCKGQHSKFFRL